MPRLCFLPILLCAWIGAALQAADTGTEQPEEFLTPEAVLRAIEGGVDYLRSTQNPNGSWEGFPGYEPGGTALVLLALLASGATPDDPAVTKGLGYIRQFPKEPAQWQTYPVSLQTMVLCQAGNTDEDRALIERNVKWLADRQFRTNNAYRGGWSYTGDVPENSRTDNSNSQFAALALYEARRIGVQVPDETWALLRDYWIRMQNPDGSWGYKAGTAAKRSGGSPSQELTGSGSGTGSMTCAGIAALAIAGDVENKGAARIDADRVECCQPTEGDLSSRIDRGLAWLGKHFSVRHNPGTDIGSDSWLFYYLYGVERVGRLTSNRFIGQSDWYREGADFLLRKKGMLNKYWKAGTDLEKVNSISTAFALLFLSKGRWPVLISKLRYEAPEQPEGEAWNLHPNDLGHLTEFIERRWQRNLIYQVIDASKATVDDYMQTPVLYICGRVSPLPEDPNARKQLVENLRGYLEQGGFILAEALDGDTTFRSGFFELVAELFPDQPQGGLRLLPEDHPVWNQEAVIPSDLLRPLYGVDFGCRTSVIFIGDPTGAAMPDGGAISVGDVRSSVSCLWELGQQSDRPLPEKVNTEVAAAFALGENILAYATGRELRFKEDTPDKVSLGTDAPSASGLFVGILDHGGGSRCAPRAIPNLMKQLASDFGIPAETEVGLVRASGDDLYRYPILFLHGRGALNFTDEQITRLRLYFDRGGFLFANAICAAPAFDRSIRAELKKIFPDTPLEEIPEDDPLFTSQSGGFEIRELEIHLPAAKDQAARAGQRKGNWSQIVKLAPELYGIKSHGRWVVIVSPYDVSCALEGHASAECAGYTKQSATRLSINILLYAAEYL